MKLLAKDLDLLESHIRIVDVRNLRRVDPILVLLALALVAIGLFTLYSAGLSAYSEVPYYVKQAVWFCLGAVAALIIISIDRRFLVSMAPYLYALSVGLLVLVPVFGTAAKGGQRWLPLGPFQFQPSEFGKLALIFMLAWYLSTVKGRIRKFPFFLLAFGIVAVPGLLILKQPNLGTAATLGPLVFVMLYVAGCKRWHFLALVLAALIPVTLVYVQVKDYQAIVKEYRAKGQEECEEESYSPKDRQAVLKEYEAKGREAYEAKSYPLGLKLKWYQIERILTFLDPEADPQNQGWQPLQTKITVGSGRLTGKGFGKSTQTYLSFLPEHHTDFIFALFAEEHGFWGSVLVISLFAAFFLRGLWLARECPDLSGTLLAVGIVTILAFHVFVNIAITIGLLPVTGLPLPFLSYGGSFYLTTMMCVGALLSVPIRRGYFV